MWQNQVCKIGWIGCLVLCPWAKDFPYCTPDSSVRCAYNLHSICLPELLRGLQEIMHVPGVDKCDLRKGQAWTRGVYCMHVVSPHGSLTHHHPGTHSLWLRLTGLTSLSREHQREKNREPIQEYNGLLSLPTFAEWAPLPRSLLVDLGGYVIFTFL